MHAQFRYAAVAVLMTALLTSGCQRNPADADDAADSAGTASKDTVTASANDASGPGGWFVSTGCTKCHAVSVYDLKSETNLGPDLSIAVDDVKSRFGVSLDEFLFDPVGTMAIVLSTEIQLTPEQRKTAIEKLNEAHAEYLRQQASGRASSSTQ